MVSVVTVFNLFYVIDEETDKRGHKRRGRFTRLSMKFHKQRRVAACAEVEEKGGGAAEGRLYWIAIFQFYLAKIENTQKVANWRLLSCQLATFLLKTYIWSDKIQQILIKVANWQLFEQFQFWLDNSKKSLFNMIWKYLIRC